MCVGSLTNQCSHTNQTNIEKSITPSPALWTTGELALSPLSLLSLQYPHSQHHHMLPQCKCRGSDTFSPGACIIQGLHCKRKITCCVADAAAAVMTVTWFKPAVLKMIWRAVKHYCCLCGGVGRGWGLVGAWMGMYAFLKSLYPTCLVTVNNRY
jgi:hypothetical protein